VSRSFSGQALTRRDARYRCLCDLNVRLADVTIDQGRVRSVALTIFQWPGIDVMDLTQAVAALIDGEEWDFGNVPRKLSR
jgi:hypothetical protein